MSMYSLRKAAQNLDMEISIRELRRSTDVYGVDAIVLPGGESTAMKIASRSENLYDEIWQEQGTIPFLFWELVLVQFYSLNRG